MKRECPMVNLEAEHRKFSDYWRAKAGKDSTKLDWNATWRNWIRRAAENGSNSPGLVANGNGHRPDKVRVAAELTAQMRAEENQPHQELAQ
jgi:hypothetical protein